jgi:hypothetical protein
MVESVTTSVIDGITQYFNQQAIGENLTVERVQAIVATATTQHVNIVVNELTANLSKQIENLTMAFERTRLSNSEVDQSTNNPRQRRATSYFGVTDGRIQRLPLDWRFPDGNPMQLWMQWNIGDSSKQVPALRVLDVKDFAFLDNIPLSEEEQKHHKGRKNKDNTRRPSRKTYSEMKFFCRYVEEKAAEAGLDVNNQSVQNVQRMFEVATKEFRRLVGVRTREQGRCLTLVQKLQAKKKAERERMVEG